MAHNGVWVKVMEEKSDEGQGRRIKSKTDCNGKLSLVLMGL